MKVLSVTGLNPEGAKKVASGLNQLLADYHLFYMNLRGYHWNVKGRHFFVLHGKFEELYNGVEEKIDEIAERMLQLDVEPTSAFSDYLKTAKLKEENSKITGKEMLTNVLEAFKYFIATQRNLIKTAEAIGDVATIDLINGYITEQEKTVWMLTSMLSCGGGECCDTECCDAR